MAQSRYYVQTLDPTVGTVYILGAQGYCGLNHPKPNASLVAQQPYYNKGNLFWVACLIREP